MTSVSRLKVDDFYKRAQNFAGWMREVAKTRREQDVSAQATLRLTLEVVNKMIEDGEYLPGFDDLASVLGRAIKSMAYHFDALEIQKSNNDRLTEALKGEFPYMLHVTDGRWIDRLEDAVVVADMPPLKVYKTQYEKVVGTKRKVDTMLVCFKTQEDMVSVQAVLETMCGRVKR